MIIAYDLWDKSDNVKYYKTLEEAEKATGISRKRILFLIKSGQKWKGCVFDESMDDDGGKKK